MTTEKHAARKSKGKPSASTRALDTVARERAALARYEKKIEIGLQRGETIAWDVGMAFDALARAGLHHAAGFDSLTDYANGRFPQGYATLKRYRRVALAFRRETVRRHGVSKLELGLKYIDLTPEKERAAEIPRLSIRVPDAKGESVREVPFATASVTDLERAIAFAQAKPSAHDDLDEANAKRARLTLQAAVAAPKGKHQHAPLVRAHALPGRGLRFDVVGIDAADLERVAKAMLAHAKKHPSAKRKVA